jgi:NAD(P)-dependent dehydrogenase (short-subunit alcohol dehydrogenase family)
MFEFNGRVAIVTGPPSWIGRKSAQLYAHEGARVVVSNIDEDWGSETVRLIQKSNGEAIFVKTDVTIPEECETLVEKTVEKFGRLDFACNNTGIEKEKNLSSVFSAEAWLTAIAVNLSGVFYCMKYEILAMSKYGGGAIVNMASILGQVGYAGDSTYVAAKRGVIGLTRFAAIEYAKKGIRVNSIGPAFIKTPMISYLEEDNENIQNLVDLHPNAHLGIPEKVAELVIWLSSIRACFITGGYYSVNGVFMAR